MKKARWQLSKPILWIPFVLVSLFLLLMVTTITTQNIAQFQEALHDNMAERGVRNLLFYEGMIIERKSEPNSRVRESILKSFASQPGFQFIGIIDPHGKFVAHFDREVIGTQMRLRKYADSQVAFFQQFAPLLTATDKKGSRWGVMHIEGQRNQSLVVERTAVVRWKRNHVRDELGNLDGSPQVVHVLFAFDAAPLDEAMQRFKKTAFLITLWVLAVGTLLLGVFILIQRDRATRSRIVASKRALKEMNSEVQRLVMEMRKQEKKAALGDLVAGIAHEIRNPLSTLKGYATYFKQLFPLESEGHAIAKIMVGETERLNRVVGDLIGISRPSDISKQKVSLKRVVETIKELLAQDAKQQDIEIEIFGADEIVEIDPDRFRQILLNISLNAFEMFEEIPISEVKTPHVLRFEIHDTDTDILLKIIDNGSGMSPEIVERVFDLYFTTKNNGVGLGLPNVQNIMDAHGGSIQVMSELGVGTCFTLHIPKTKSEEKND